MNVLNLHSLLIICLVSFLIKQLAKLVYGFRKQFLIAGFTLVRDFMSTLYICKNRNEIFKFVFSFQLDVSIDT